MTPSRRARAAEGGGCLLVVLVIALIVVVLFLLVKDSPEFRRASAITAAQVQPPVQVTTTPFLVFRGCYVNLLNTSSTTTMTGVVVTYTAADGAKRQQTVGVIRPGELKILDPSELGWAVVKNEFITVSADGYLPKTVETNSVIK